MISPCHGGFATITIVMAIVIEGIAVVGGVDVQSDDPLSGPKISSKIMEEENNLTVPTREDQIDVFSDDFWGAKVYLTDNTKLPPLNPENVIFHKIETKLENVIVLPRKDRQSTKISLEKVVPPDLPTGRFRNIPSCRKFVTPNALAVQNLAGQTTNVEDAYSIAVNWVWVSDETLLEQEDGWLFPQDFLTKTQIHPNNPVPGKIVSDCESQAYTLVSLLRAIGVSAENVRVAAGRVKFGDQEGGHAWVEIYIKHEWVQLEPTSGPYWDDDDHHLEGRDGLTFDYYGSHDYPALEIWGYFNDIYYHSKLTGEGNAPSHWQTDSTQKSGFLPMIFLPLMLASLVGPITGIALTVHKKKRRCKK